MFVTLRALTRAAASLVAVCAFSAMALAAPIGHTSFGVAGGFSIPNGTNLGTTNSITITNGGAIVVTTPDPFDLSALITLGETGTMQSLPNLSGFTAISSFLSLSSGVSVDLDTLTINNRTGGPPGYINMSGEGVLHAPGFDATPGLLSWAGTTTDNLTFSFAAEASAQTPPPSVPEPLSLSLLGLGILGLGVRRRAA